MRVVARPAETVNQLQVELSPWIRSGARNWFDFCEHVTPSPLDPSVLSACCGRIVDSDIANSAGHLQREICPFHLCACDTSQSKSELSKPAGADAGHGSDPLSHAKIYIPHFYRRKVSVVLSKVKSDQTVGGGGVGWGGPIDWTLDAP